MAANENQDHHVLIADRIRMEEEAGIEFLGIVNATEAARRRTMEHRTLSIAVIAAVEGANELNRRMEKTEKANVELKKSLTKVEEWIKRAEKEAGGRPMPKRAESAPATGKGSEQ